MRQAEGERVAPGEFRQSSMNDSRAKLFAVAARPRYDPCRKGGSQATYLLWFFAIRYGVLTSAGPSSG